MKKKQSLEGWNQMKLVAEHYAKREIIAKHVKRIIEWLFTKDGCVWGRERGERDAMKQQVWAHNEANKIQFLSKREIFPISQTL